MLLEVIQLNWDNLVAKQYKTAMVIEFVICPNGTIFDNFPYCDHNVPIYLVSVAMIELLRYQLPPPLLLLMIFHLFYYKYLFLYCLPIISCNIPDNVIFKITFANMCKLTIIFACDNL
jgi:hypothetical protein